MVRPDEEGPAFGKSAWDVQYIVMLKQMYRAHFFCFVNLACLEEYDGKHLSRVRVLGLALQSTLDEAFSERIVALYDQGLCLLEQRGYRWWFR